MSKLYQIELYIVGRGLRLYYVGTFECYTLRKWRISVGRNGMRSSGLTEYGDSFRIAAKIGNFFFYEFKGKDLNTLKINQITGCYH